MSIDKILKLSLIRLYQRQHKNKEAKFVKNAFVNYGKYFIPRLSKLYNSLSDLTWTHIQGNSASEQSIYKSEIYLK